MFRASFGEGFRGGLTAALVATALVFMAGSPAEAHGGRGRYVVASGPVAVIPAPATTFYGGFAQAPYYQPAQAYAPAYQATTVTSGTAYSPAGGWGGDWYLAPSPYGYVSPGAILATNRVHPHPWVPVRFYRP